MEEINIVKFLVVFWLILDRPFISVDLNPDPGSQNVIDPTDSGSDLKHLSLMLQEDVHLLAHLSSDALLCVQCTFKMYYL